jgi:hypothetical protein
MYKRDERPWGLSMYGRPLWTGKENIVLTVNVWEGKETSLESVR